MTKFTRCLITYTGFGWLCKRTGRALITYGKYRIRKKLIQNGWVLKENTYWINKNKKVITSNTLMVDHHNDILSGNYNVYIFRDWHWVLAGPVNIDIIETLYTKFIQPQLTITIETVYDKLPK